MQACFIAILTPIPGNITPVCLSAFLGPEVGYEIGILALKFARHVCLVYHPWTC